MWRVFWLKNPKSIALSTSPNLTVDFSWPFPWKSQCEEGLPRFPRWLRHVLLLNDPISIALSISRNLALNLRWPFSRKPRCEKGFSRFLCWVRHVVLHRKDLSFDMEISFWENWCHFCVEKPISLSLCFNRWFLPRQ